MYTLLKKEYFPLASLPLFLILVGAPGSAGAQTNQPVGQRVAAAPADLQTTEDWNRRLADLLRSAEPVAVAAADEYRIGPEDLLDITVFEAPELNRNLRVSASGELSLPLLGSVKAVGLTPRELEFVLQELLRRTYMKDPHVSVFVREMESHPVSVFGAVRRPGVYQIRGTRTLLGVLSMAEGLAEDAGDTVLVMRGETGGGKRDQSGRGEKPGGPGSFRTQQADEPVPDSSALPGGGEERALEISLKQLLESGDARHNVAIYPGDIVKVTRAGIVYVVGEVNKAGGFVLESNENISVLQALALAEGLKSTAAKGHARIIRTEEDQDQRVEIPVDLGKVLAGKAPDPLLRPNDILFVPDSPVRRAFYRAGEAAISIVTGVIIWRR